MFSVRVSVSLSSGIAYIHIKQQSDISKNNVYFIFVNFLISLFNNYYEASGKRSIELFTVIHKYIPVTVTYIYCYSYIYSHSSSSISFFLSHHPHLTLVIFVAPLMFCLYLYLFLLNFCPKYKE